MGDDINMNIKEKGGTAWTAVMCWDRDKCGLGSVKYGECLA